MDPTWQCRDDFFGLEISIKRLGTVNKAGCLNCDVMWKDCESNDVTQHGVGGRYLD